MAIYLIRTAVAVRREHWDGAAADRPLTLEGRAQAVAIARWLSPVQVSHILSSPRPRCVQTVTPLADQFDLEVEQLDSLLTGHDVQLVLDWLRVLPDSSVLCTHDKVITRVTEILTRQGAELDGPVDFGKGAIWILERSAGRIERIHAVHPPVDNDLATTR
jgi:phosphohistidine phosphatase SixA